MLASHSIMPTHKHLRGLLLSAFAHSLYDSSAATRAAMMPLRMQDSAYSGGEMELMSATSCFPLPTIRSRSRSRTEQKSSERLALDWRIDRVARRHRQLWFAIYSRWQGLSIPAFTQNCHWICASMMHVRTQSHVSQQLFLLLPQRNS